MKNETHTAIQSDRAKRRGMILAGYLLALLIGAGAVYAYMDRRSGTGSTAALQKVGEPTNPGAAKIGVPGSPAQVTKTADSSSTAKVPNGVIAPELVQGEPLANLAERLLPAVVSISTTQVRRSKRAVPRARPNVPPGSPFEEFFKDYFDRPRPGQRRATAVGSGFIIDPTGYIVTNNHVIANATEVKVILQNKTKLDAKVVGRDAKADLALLKVKSKQPLPTVPWGNSGVMRVGHSVFAIGNPFGLGGTVTSGIVSARHRHIGGLGGRAGSSFVDFIQTDAAINKGNSGGPLFNMRGEVIGINTAIYSRRGTNVGIAFAIPTNLAKPIIEQLRKFGRTKRGWLGVQIQNVSDEIAQSLGLKKATGALVANVTAGGPAAQAGIKQGDVILRFNDQVVPEMRRLPRMVAATEVGREVSVVVWRKGKEVTLKIKLGELEKFEKASKQSASANQDAKPKAAPKVKQVLGMTLATPSAQLRRQFQLSGKTPGVLIVNVSPNSAAGEKGVRPGDLILEAGQVKVSSPAQIKKIVEKAGREGARSILLLIKRGKDTRFLALRVTKS